MYWANRLLKFHRNLLESVGIVLKSHLSLIISNQHCQAVVKEKLCWVLGGTFGQESSNLHDPHYQVGHLNNKTNNKVYFTLHTITC